MARLKGVIRGIMSKKRSSLIFSDICSLFP
jgi:hypothetical protein